MQKNSKDAQKTHSLFFTDKAIDSLKIKGKERIKKWEEENIELTESHNDNEDNEDAQASKRS